MSTKIGIILGSDSDFPFIEKGVKMLKEFQVPFRVEVSSAHRTPERTAALVKEFEESGVEVIVAAAGGAAHLPGVIASQTQLPVLGVPMQSALSGIDSLYSIVQMPGGIPVATFGIGESGAVNAVLFALEIMAVNDREIKKKLLVYREKQKMTVNEKNDRLKEKIDAL